MSEDLSVLLAKLNSMSGDFAVMESFDGHGHRREDKPSPVYRHTCSKKQVRMKKSQAIIHEIKMLGMSKKTMLDWCEWLENAINGRVRNYTVVMTNLQGIYSDERQKLLKLIYKIPYKFNLVTEAQDKLYYCTQYTTFSNDSRDVHCRVTIYKNVISVLNEMSVWKMRFREALDSTQQVQYDSLHNAAKQSVEAWVSVAEQRMGTQALAYWRASQVSNQRRTLRG